MFDLTPEIKLASKSYRIYRYFQIIFYLLVFILAFYLIFLIFFPQRNYIFSFLNPNSKKNSITLPINEEKTSLQNGKLSPAQKLIFDTSLVGSYSEAIIHLTLTSKLPANSSLSLLARKSYKSFFYPLGSPIGFKNGSLLKHDNHYYIVSHNQLREFANLQTLTQLGYLPKNFQEISKDELKINSLGEKIKTGDNYPEDTLFKIKDTFYLLEQYQLRPFSSLAALKTQYDPQQAINKSSDFIKKYPLSNNPIGFADGTLISQGISVYIVSQGHIHPINNAQTFLANGYQWKDIIPASEDELSLYERTSLFKISDYQPTGTIFKTTDSKYYLIKNSQKHLLPGKKIAQSWLRTNSAILVSQDLSRNTSCQLEKDFLKSNSYSCHLPLEQLATLLGTNYRYSLTTPQNIQLNKIEVTYKKKVSLATFKESLKGFLITILGKYAQI